MPQNGNRYLGSDRSRENRSPSGSILFILAPASGGHCIPVDPFCLSWKAKEWDFHTGFIELAGEINSNMPYHVLDSVARALIQQKKAVNR